MTAKEVSPGRFDDQHNRIKETLQKGLPEHRQAADELCKSEEGYQLLAASVDSMYLVDSECRYLFLNESQRGRIGIPLEDIIGRRYGDFHSEESARDFAEKVKGVIETAKVSSQEHRSERDGRYFLRTFSPAIKDSPYGEVTVVIVVSKEITERKRLEEELKQYHDHLLQTVQEGKVELQMKNDLLRQVIVERRSATDGLQEWKERYRWFFDNSVQGILATDIETQRLLYANASICRMLGYSDAELLQLGIAAIHPKGLLDQVMSDIEPLARGGDKATSSALPCLRKDGTVFYADIDGVSTIINGRRCAVGFFTDVTEREQVKEERDRLVAILEATPDFIGFADAKTTRIRYINQAGRRICSIGEHDDVNALKIADLHPEWTNRLLAQESLPTAIREGMWEGECAFVDRDGREIPVSMVIMAHKSATGDVDYFSTISRDITEHQWAEEKIKALNKELQDRMQQLTEVKALEEKASRVKTEFMANISHELTTPLNSIIGFSQVLLEKNFGDLNEKQRGYLENILHSGEQLYKDLENIVSFVCMDVSNPDMDWEDLRLKDIVASSLSIFRKDATDRHLTLTFDMATEADRTIRADRGKLVQVFHNILSNAVKFSRGGGQITISVGNRKGSEGSGKDDFMDVIVADMGIGIKEEDLPRLFQPFEQLEAPLTKQFAGVGMGLVLARKLIEAHGGAIRAESEFGKGTKIIFTIPVKGRK